MTDAQTSTSVLKHAAPTIADDHGSTDGDDVQGHKFWLWELLTFIPDLPPEQGPYPPGVRTDDAR